MTRNIKLTLEYDGSGFFGFQKQPDRNTVQQSLENALSRLFGKSMKIASASGRTDAGVHALGQVVNFKTESGMALWQIKKALNGILPKAIAVRCVQEVPAGFHARFSAKSKTYEYGVWNDRARSPLLAAKTFHFPGELNVRQMRLGAKLLSGRHDFRSFCASGTSEDGKTKSTVRTLKTFVIRKKGSFLIFQVQADGFLYHMVRNLVGTLLDLGRGRLTLEDLQKILKARDRRQAGATVPAHALTLITVEY